MALPTSEYGFPIFISSTDYNLIDLRAELAKYLADLGYRPILSSSDGFHDNSPDLEPWESCLQVLQSAYVMVLVIDGKYGELFEWKNFAAIIGERKVSPTHAEYILAHKTKMRMLVFVRRELLTYYQTYRTAIKNSKGDKEKAKQSLAVSLPKHIAFETLEFIEEVKTSRPIPWIKSFENVTEIKQEIQKKMLNELAELFLFKNKHLEAVVRAFSTVLDDLPADKRKETLQKIGATKELIIEIEGQTKVILDLKKEKQKLQSELTIKEDELRKAVKAKKKETSSLKKTIETLTQDVGRIDTRITNHELNNANYIISGSTILSSSVGSTGSSLGVLGGTTSSLFPSGSLGAHTPITTVLSGLQYEAAQQCDKCHSTLLSNRTTVPFGPLKRCPTCNRNLCNNCFYGSGTTPVLFNSECADCSHKKTTTTKETK
ncbi:MAG: hypothetical protein POELPBGB_01606 [Bacteroidia bacterium]|nr:hypothetical protein [Bacteroidia bacterium]